VKKLHEKHGSNFENFCNLITILTQQFFHLLLLLLLLLMSSFSNPLIAEQDQRHFQLTTPTIGAFTFLSEASYGAFTLDVQSVLLNENLGGILGGTHS
jgi:hypothetical protein